jgi:serine-type D-Ala-D-Ala carboxypeptidase/endopeptidase (penicillin-binding protein 4)
MNRRRVRSAALLLLTVVLVVAAAAGGYLVTHQLRADSAASDRPAGTSTPSALASATAPPGAAPASSTAPEPTPAAVAAALAKDVANARLGGRVLARVVDATTGDVLYDHLGSLVAAPASTAKLLTAAALLTVRPAAYRITTTVVADPDGTIVLVGAGDPTLTGATGSKAGAYPDAARIGELARQLRAAHMTVARLVVDDSLFVGPNVSPSWADEDVPSFYAAPITALMSDGGRAAPADFIRSTAPDLDAGHELATALGVPTVPVSRGKAATDARVVASVQSPPITELVEQMLGNSDNVIAECLARQVAIASGQPASFAGAAAAIQAALAGLGVDPGAGMLDASGLAVHDRISAATLAAVLRIIVGSDHPELHDIVTALPVAGWSGTLADRYLRGSPARAGAGVVRAKTGTLTTVSALAGLVHDEDGRLLVFALMADRVAAGDAPTESAKAALDQIAATLASCGCT